MTHSSDYLAHKAKLQRLRTITIVGSGQSAAEVYYDLLVDAPQHGYELVWLTRSPRFFPMEYTKLTLEMTSPEYGAYHRALPVETRDRLAREQRHLFKGISGDLVDAIFDLHYQQRVIGDGPRTTLLTNTEVRGARSVGAGHELDLLHVETGESFGLTTDGLVLATGYAPTAPAFLDGVRDRIRFDERGRYDVAGDYSVDVNGGEIFVQNAEEHTHSLAGAGPRHGRLPQLRDHRRDARSRGLPGREADRRTDVRRARPPASFAGGCAMRLTIEPLDLERDAELLGLLHAWVTHPRSKFWMMQDATLNDVRREYGDIVANPHHDAFLGRADGRPAFLVETYDPRWSALADLPELEPGDLGMHVMIGPPEGEPLPGYTSQVFAAVLEHCFADPAVRRVVVEPDVDNAAIRVKNIDAGFVELREVPVPGKTAMLSVCTREAYERASGMSAPHLTPAFMDLAHRHLVAKAIGEYAHERLIAPVPDAERAGLADAGP